MSHLVKMNISAKQSNERELVESLTQFFGEGTVEVHNNAQELTGYDSGSNMKANIIVRRADIGKKTSRRAWNDLVYERMVDGSYELHADPSDIRDTELAEISRGYLSRVSERCLMDQGFILDRTVTKSNGEIEIYYSSFN
jgi:hypothetical protein